MLSGSACVDLLPEVARRLDEPFGDPSILPTLLLSRFARRHVTVALAGDGGDELFAGYDPFLAHRPGQWLSRLPLAGAGGARPGGEPAPRERHQHEPRLPAQAA